MDPELIALLEWPINSADNDKEYWAKYAKRAKFWDAPSTFEWFKTRGYTLYERYGFEEDEDQPYPDQSIPRIPDHDDYVKANYPYAHHHVMPGTCAKESRSAGSTYAKLAFAQDTDGRHVVIKLVLRGSDQHRIMEMLKQESMETLEQNGMLPILDILSIERFCFVVMPRWGDSAMIPEPDSLGAMLEVMRVLLKGLCFLHSKNIVHRDVSTKNFLVNCFTESGCIDNGDRQRLRKAGQLRYAIFDFDISILASEGTDRATFRLPYWEAWDGSFPRPPDINHGQPDYNPFAFDVGCLGIIFCHWSQHHCRDVPFLAPFLDRMTARNPSRRFTAQEALNFFNDRISLVTNDVLSKCYHKPCPLEAKSYDYYNRWKELPASFAQEWEEYREPPVPPVVRFLRWVYSFETLGRLIPYVRWHVQRLYLKWI